MKKSNPPSTDSKAFNCPYCHVFTSQAWLDVSAKRVITDDKTPGIPDEASEEIDFDQIEDNESRQRLKDWFINMTSGEPFTTPATGHCSPDVIVNNIFLSRCYNCGKIAVWVHKKLMYPTQRVGPEPNPDLPEDIINDFEEARAILELSPRGAAALLRLCVQKLCATLGGKGENINEDIASFVAKGLDPIVQKALDVVRVIGNEAVHPGVINLRDDRETALKLFTLVNFIAEQMISLPKSVSELYDTLPQDKRDGITIRNQKALKT